jgi:hypothetical protein
VSRPDACGIDARVTIEVRPATVFDDVKTVLGPKRPDATVCWCLSYRIPSKENRALVGRARERRVKALMMAYVGTRRHFERVGFTKVADTDSVLDGFPRVLMRLDLRG